MRPLIALALILLATTAYTQTVTQTLSTTGYVVKFGGMSVAKLTRTLQLTEGRYQIDSELVGQGLAAILGGPRLHETSAGSFAEGVLQPERYRHIDERKGRDRLFEVVRDKGEVQSSHLETPLAAPEDLQVVVSHILALRLALARGRTSYDVPVLSGNKRKIYIYSFRTSGAEQIKSPFGVFEAIKVVRETSRGKYKMTFWCAPELEFTPIRIERLDAAGRTVIMQLESYSVRPNGG